MGNNIFQERFYGKDNIRIFKNDIYKNKFILSPLNIERINLIRISYTCFLNNELIDLTFNTIKKILNNCSTTNSNIIFLHNGKICNEDEYYYECRDKRSDIKNSIYIDEDIV